jgi:4a-hydroxytetrahydrobiopterin dehydratase
MPMNVTAREFDAHGGLDDWRYLLGGIVATFRLGSFAAAAQLVSEIAAAADAADHHPDVDLRYPDHLKVALTTHAVGGLTDRDLSLAATISGLVARAGGTTELASCQTVEVALDAIDIPAVLPFWRAVLGYVDDVPPGHTGPVIAIRDPARIGPPFWFQQMEEPRTERNRFHIDVTVPHDHAEARIAAALAAGGTMVTDRYARSWWVLADAEGNEACVCTWQDRD